MKNVVAYIRVSTEGQCGEDKFGLEAQREQIKDYCRRNDMNIVRWYSDEGESGAKYRPGFDEIVYGEEIGNPPFEAVVVAKSDRVARDINIYYYYKACLLRKGVNLISIAEDFGQFGVFSSMLESFVLCMAQMERENITKRTSGGRKVKAAKGGYAGGQAPMGYRVKEGKLVINPEEAEIVREIYRMRSEGRSLTGIAEDLTKAGYRTRKGKAFCFSTIQSVLSNEKTYRGYYHYGKDGEWVAGQHEAILA